MDGKGFGELTFKELSSVQLQQIHEGAELFLDSGSWLLDVVQAKLTLSKGWRAIHGIDKTKLTLHELMPIAHPEDINEISRAFDNCVENGIPYKLTHKIIRQDNGDERTIKVYAEALEKDDEGRALKIFGVVQDITAMV